MMLFSRGGALYRSAFEALDRSQATIQFDLDGTILTANRLFLTPLAMDSTKSPARNMRSSSIRANATAPNITPSGRICAMENSARPNSSESPNPALPSGFRQATIPCSTVPASPSGS